MNRKIWLVLLLLLIVLSLSACGFVRYVAYGEAEEETPDSPEEYLALLAELVYPNANEEQQNQYDFLLLDAENALLECADADEMAEVYDAYAEALLEYTTEIVREEIKALAAEQYYRAAEQLEVDALLASYLEIASEPENGAQALALFYQFKTELGQIKTDKVLYAEELAVLKKAYSADFADVNYALYRDAQRTQLRALSEQFDKGLVDLDTKEECEALYAAYCDTLARLPKAAELLEGERAATAAYWQGKLSALANKYALSLDAEIAALVSAMASTTVAAANRAGGEFVLAHFASCASRDELAEAAATVIENAAADLRYRDPDADIVKGLRDAALNALASLSTATEMQSLIEGLKTDVADVPTNDERYAAELAAFRAALTARYGTYVLCEPASLTVANSYLELGKIIDYYAFYQLDGSSFLDGSFRVQLNFPHRYAEWELVEMHWYCELIRSAVGLLGSFEADSSQMVFTLVPYAIATETNREGEADINRFPTMIQFDSDPTTQTVRGDSFDDFPYLSSYTARLSGIWNSQQLWYALEHNYLPEVVPGSPAERVLERAKEILREVIRDGMSTEEKIFRIYSWFAINVEYDNDFSLMLDHPDRYLLPDHNTAVLNSFHIEGSLFDGLAVCCGYAKAYLLLLRMEGIESYRLALNYDDEHAISGLGASGYGSHAVVAIRASDGKFYYSDVEQSFARGNTLSSYHQLLLPHTFQSTWHSATNKVFAPYLEFGTELPAVMWDKLLYNGKQLLLRSEAELYAILDDFADHPNKNELLILYASPAYDFPVTSNILADGRFELWVYSYNGFYEYFIYPAT